MYYEHWLHMDQIVTLETAGGIRARIKASPHSLTRSGWAEEGNTDFVFGPGRY